MIDKKQSLNKLLAHFDNNKSKCAFYLNISRATLYNWIKNPDIMPVKKIIKIQEITGGNVSLFDIFPEFKYFMKISDF